MALISGSNCVSFTGLLFIYFLAFLALTLEQTQATSFPGSDSRDKFLWHWFHGQVVFLCFLFLCSRKKCFFDWLRFQILCVFPSLALGLNQDACSEIDWLPAQGLAVFSCWPFYPKYLEFMFHFGRLFKFLSIFLIIN